MTVSPEMVRASDPNGLSAEAQIFRSAELTPTQDSSPRGETSGMSGGVGNLPRVSIVIPVRNDAKSLEICLRSLTACTYPRSRMEILVMDGQSDDDTAQVAESFAHAGEPIRVVSNPRRSRCAAMNLGIQEAKGEVIVRVDGRNVVPPDYVKRCVETLLATGADNVGGVIKPLHAGIVQQAIGDAMSHPFGVGNAQFRLGRKSGPCESAYLGCFRREVFDRVGLFDDSASVITEDADINERIRAKGGLVYLNTAIEIGYYPRARLIDLGRLYFRYGGARAGYVSKHGRLSSLRQVVPPLFLLCVVILAALSFLHPFAYALTVVLSIYLLADLCSSAQLAWSHHKLALFFPLTLAFPLMHVPWAVGFLLRLLQRSGAREWSY